MKKSITLLVALTALLISSSTPLMQKAKRSGLAPIPNDPKELLKLIDPNKQLTSKRIQLGRMLYFEPRISKSGLISCNWCHKLSLGGVDGIPRAIGHMWRGNPLHLNSPTVYNAVFAKRQFWDGRSSSLEDQAKGPIQAPQEMAATQELVAKRINSIPEYVKLFKEAYGDNVKIDFNKIATTIALFERTLVTPSRYDDYLNGNDKALTKEEKEGLEIFIDKGCTTCHKGIALGGDMQPFELRDKYKFKKVGGFSGNGSGMIKAPTLRNITQTAPYFHNGMIWDLKDAIREMSHIQVGFKVKSKDKSGKMNIEVAPINLSENDVDKIRKFFNALEGRKPKIIYPELPKSTLKTPKPITKE